MSEEQLLPAVLDAVTIFTGPQGVEKILADIEKQVLSFVPDTASASGRKNIASLAYKVSQSKVVLDDLGKGLVTEWKQKSALVDASRKTARDRLDALRDKAREPLTIWEQEEAARIAAEKLAKELEQAEDEARSIHDLWLRQKAIEAKEAELARIEAARIAKEVELARIEAERIAAEKAEAERKANEERIRQEAADKAKKDAEEAAKKQIEEAERKAAEAKEAVEKAERDRIAAEKKAIEDQAAAVRAAEEKARIEAARVEAERKRIEAETAAKAEAERKEAERKAADVEHRRTVNKEVLAGLIDAGISERQAQLVITSIVKGLVKHVSIKY